MPFKDKIINIIKIIYKYFLTPFFYSSLATLIIIFILDIKINFLNSNIILYLSIVLVYFIFFKWFKNLENNKIKNIIIVFFNSLFILSILLILVLNLNFLHILINYNIILVTTIIFSGFLLLYVNILPFKNNLLIKKQKKIYQYKKNYIYVSILIIGFILRIWNINKISFNVDEGIYSILLKNFNHSFLPILDSGALYLRNFLYIYLLLFLNFFINNSLLSERFISIISGTALLSIVFFLTKKLFNINAALLAIFLCAINGFLIAQSIQGRHYMLMYALYFLFIYFTLFVKFNNNYKILTYIFLAFILASNFEFVFLLIPFLFIILWFRREKIILFSTLLIILLYFIQPLYLTKSVQYSINLPPIRSSKSLINLSLDNKFINTGVKRMFFSLQPYLYIIIFIIIIKLKKFFSILKNKNIFSILILFLTEIVFYSFFLERNQARYRGTLIIFSIIFLSILSNIIIKKSNRYKVLLMNFLIIFLILLIPININYPVTADYLEEEYSNNISLLRMNFNQPLSFSSINTNTVEHDYSELKNIIFHDGSIIISTDMYNLNNYINVDFIFNPELEKNNSYIDINNNIRCFYNNIKFIHLNEIQEFIKNKKVYLVADSRFSEHLSQKEQNFIIDNFKIIYKSDDNFIGKIDRRTSNVIKVFYYE